MSGVATAIVGSAVIGGGLAYMGSQGQASAMESAANSQNASARNSVDAQLKMWEKAQEDFAPYLDAGDQGLATLTQNMPQYISKVLTPLAQEVASYQSSNPIAPGSGIVNPVTGEITPISQVQSGNMLTSQSGLQPSTTGQSSTASRYYASGSPSSGISTTVGRGAILGGMGNALSKVPGSGGVMGKVGDTLSRVANLNSPPPTSLPGQAQEVNQPMQFDAFQPGATTQQLEQGGVLSPTTPDLPGQVDFSFDENDPIYQFKLKQAEDAQKRYLSAIGGTNSSNALTKMRDTGLAVAAEDADKQFSRQQTERNYLAQSLTDKYNMDASRGDTLYNRQNTASGNALTGTQNALTQYDQNSINDLLRAYGAYNDLYGLNYGSALDLSKIGSGQAGAAGANSMQTGNALATQYGNMGQAAANSTLGQSQINANMLNTIGYQTSNTMNQLANYYNGGYSGYTTPQNYGTGTSAFNNFQYNPPVQTSGGSYIPGAWG